MSIKIPDYIKTHKKGLLKEKKEKAFKLLENCTLCPRNCKVNRLSGEKGICNTGKDAIVSSYAPHFGEESPLVGQNGSGTIFFTHCNLLCNFCQNYDISHEGNGSNISDEQLARIMIHLQEMGCHNINFVTPSHVVPQILSALEIAIDYGLTIPLVYNSGGYDNVTTLQLLDGIIDIYMPDFKFWDNSVAKQTCNISNYREIACNTVTEMYRQVGDLIINKHGVASRGLLIRHLVLPEEMAGSKNIMHFIAKKISSKTYVNIMPQYRPCGKAYQINKLNRKITQDEFNNALTAAKQAGLTRLDKDIQL